VNRFALPLFPEQASTVAGEVDALYFFVVAVSVFFATLIAALLIVFSIRYRRRSEDELPTPMHGSLPLELLWTIVPFCISMVFFFWGASVFLTLSRPPDDALEIFVVGKQWMWKLQHREGRREINELHCARTPGEADHDVRGRDSQLLHPRVPHQGGYFPAVTTLWFGPQELVPPLLYSTAAPTAHDRPRRGGIRRLSGVARRRRRAQRPMVSTGEALFSAWLSNLPSR
jgi:amino acid transporter